MLVTYMGAIDVVSDQGGMCPGLINFVAAQVGYQIIRVGILASLYGLFNGCFFTMSDIH